MVEFSEIASSQSRRLAPGEAFDLSFGPPGPGRVAVSTRVEVLPGEGNEAADLKGEATVHLSLFDARGRRVAAGGGFLEHYVTAVSRVVDSSAPWICHLANLGSQAIQVHCSIRHQDHRPRLRRVIDLEALNRTLRRMFPGRAPLHLRFENRVHEQRETPMGTMTSLHTWIILKLSEDGDKAFEFNTRRHLLDEGTESARVDLSSTVLDGSFALRADIRFREGEGRVRFLPGTPTTDIAQLKLTAYLMLHPEGGRVGLDLLPRCTIQLEDGGGNAGFARGVFESEIENAFREIVNGPEHASAVQALAARLLAWVIGARRLSAEFQAKLEVTYPQESSPTPTVEKESGQEALQVGNLGKIDHIVVLMMENRSFDHLLGYLALEGGRDDVEGPSGRETHSFAGRNFSPHPLRETVFPYSPCHCYTCVQKQIAGGEMTGFVENFVYRLHEDYRTPDITILEKMGDVMGYHRAEQVWAYDALAREFAVCDRWFSSCPGPAFPNRFMALTGKLALSTDGQPQRDNPEVGNFAPLLEPTLFDHLSARSVSWRYYEHDFCTLRTLERYTFDEQHIVAVSDPQRGFYASAAQGTLPSVAFIDPPLTDTPPSSDDHPPADLTRGQDLVARVYDALRQGRAWERTLLIVVYDQHGGFYDHVAPPEAPEVSDIHRLGVRVPALVVSPWVERGRVHHSIYDHTSIIKTVLTRFLPDTYPGMGPRVAWAPDLGELLSGSSPREDSLLLGHPSRSRLSVSSATPPSPVGRPGQPVHFHTFMRRFREQILA